MGCGLTRARIGKEKDLAFTEEVGVAEFGICVGNARPGSGMTEMSPCNGPQRIAVENVVLGGGALRRGRHGNQNLRPSADDVWIAKARIQ